MGKEVVLGITSEDHKRVDFLKGFFHGNTSEYVRAVKDEMRENGHKEVIRLKNDISRKFDKGLRTYIDYGAAYLYDAVPNSLKSVKVTSRHSVKASKIFQNSIIEDESGIPQVDFEYLERAIGDDSTESIHIFNNKLSHLSRAERDLVFVGYFAVGIALAVAVKDHLRKSVNTQ